MTTQVSFTADENLKNKALQKAKDEGITLKTLFIYTMKGFVEGKISLEIQGIENEPDVEELTFKNKSVNKKAEKLAKLLL
ncbi:hypothetical protein HYW83_00040 [Candidatus Peregrinibacteria bacterium]|nr:hypothetical protein [Candidatus Peregrinibacteria bacterium]